MSDCGLAEGVTLEFPISGVIVRVRDADIRAKRRNFVMANVEVTEEAAKLIANDVPEKSYGYIRFDGERARRLYRPPNAVTFKEDLDRMTFGEVTLKDPRYVLENGNITKQWNYIKLGDAVEYILDHTDDQFGVIEDVQFVDERYKDFKQARQGPALDFIADKLGDLLRWFEIRGDPSFRQSMDTIDLNDASPLEALQKVMSVFEFEWWVDPDGTLWIGNNIGTGNVFATVANDNRVALKSYSVTRASTQVNSVQVKGPLKKTFQNSNYKDYTLQDGVQVLAEASVPTAPGSPISLEREKSVSSPEVLERIAGSRLIQRMMDDVEGSLTINGQASTATERLAKMDIGDILYVDDSIEGECNEDVSTGLFIINTLQHRVNRSRGWEITCRVSKIPDPDAIEMKSVIYDPYTDTRYEDLEAFKAQESIEEQEEDEDQSALGEFIEDSFIVL